MKRVALVMATLILGAGLVSVGLAERALPLQLLLSVEALSREAAHVLDRQLGEATQRPAAAFC